MKIQDSQSSPAIKGGLGIAAWLILGIGATFFPTASVSKQVTFTQSGARDRERHNNVADHDDERPRLLDWPRGSLRDPPPSAEPTNEIKNVVIVRCDLPRAFLPPSLPARPIDENLRVGLVLPAFDPDPERNATWLRTASEPFWDGVLGVPRDVHALDRVILNFAEPTAAVLPRIIRRLFPRTEIIRPHADISQYDLALRIALTSSTIVGPDNTVGGAEVVGTITAEGPDGTTVYSVTASGRGEVAKASYWSQNWSDESRGRAVGVLALQSLLDDLVRKIQADPSFNAHVREIAAWKARPSELETTAKFDDSVGLFPNGRLDGGENARLLFKVHNRGPGPAFAVRLRSSATKEIVFPVDTEIGDLPAGGEKEVSVAIGGSLGLETGILKLPIETIEKRGYGGRQIILEVATEKLRRPNLEIADISLSDPGGRSRGGDGRPSNGETLEAVVLIRNSGPGDAAGVELTMSSATGRVEILEPSVGVGSIPVNGVREARMHVRLPVTFDARDLSLTFRAVEARGTEVGRASKDKTWQVQLKRPAVEITYRMYDGNSAGSRGDRDGVVNNGEEVELVLSPINHGALAARDVRISLLSRQAGVTLSQETFAVGDLPANAEAAEQRVRLQISRTLGRDAAIPKLALAATITQRDFPAREEPIGLSFKARHPELVANVTSSSSLVEGESAILWLEVRNQGLLAATGVQVEVISGNPGIELLDELGAPTRKLTLAVGTVGAQMSVPRIQIKAHVRRNISAVGAMLKVVASQQDFPSVDQQASLHIQREEAAIISATPPPLAKRPVNPAALSPANVSFRRYENGDHVAEETVALRFAVQSERELDTVRLEQNGRSIELAEPKRSEGNLWLYEQRINLAYGENDFEVIVVTAEGIRSNGILSINRDRREGKIWVAVVGVSKYSGAGITELNFATDDAAAVLLYYRERFGLPEEQMIQLLDEKATLVNIKRMLGTELVRNATNPNDTVILYFAGHGMKDPDPGSQDSDGFSKYLLPYDAILSDLFGSALSMEEVGRILQRLRPERVVLIIDSCFSGAAGGGRTVFDTSDGTRSVVVTDEFLSRMATAGKGRVILTASSTNELARERPDFGHGIFTHFLLQGLNGEADVDGDGQIDVDEIYKFVSQSVVGATRGQQNPVKKAPSLTGTVVLGKTSIRVKH